MDTPNATSSPKASSPKFSESLAGAAHEGVDYLAKRADSIQEQLVKTGGKAAARTRAAGDHVSGYVSDHPFASLGIAVGVGFLVGSLLRRR